MADWKKIRQEWETTSITFVDLAEKHDLKTSTVRSRKNREKWQINEAKRELGKKEGKRPTMVTCTKCGEKLPSTPEYFHRDNRTKLGIRANCKKCCQKQRKISYADNRELLIRQGKKWRASSNGQLWRKENKKALNIRGQIRRAKKRELPHTLTIKQWEETKEHFNDSCAYCGVTESEHKNQFEQVLHQEHIIPLSGGGGYTKDNIIPSCHKCNSSKGDSNLKDWYQSKNYYDKEKEDKILNFIKEWQQKDKENGLEVVVVGKAKKPKQR